MIITSCPLRVSLVGGSTDHPEFIKRYKQGSVISFASNLNTYVAVHQDYFGMNSMERKYSLSYSKKETVENVDDIQNEMIRHTFKELGVRNINCSLTSDIYSVGSGLAASSSYVMALIQAIYSSRGKFISTIKIAELAEKIEKKFNPLVGKQDFYGGVIGGFKRIDFNKGKTPSVTFLDTAILDEMDIYLYYTGVNRESKNILKTINVDKSIPMIHDVSELEMAVKKKDISKFNDVINSAWENKKKISKDICSNQNIIEIDEMLQNNSNVLSHKLCGAGNGGYFVVFSHKNSCLDMEYDNMKKIGISDTGINSVNINELRRI